MQLMAGRRTKLIDCVDELLDGSPDSKANSKHQEPHQDEGADGKCYRPASNKPAQMLSHLHSGQAGFCGLRIRIGQLSSSGWG